jgi:hypothetical protein
LSVESWRADFLYIPRGFLAVEDLKVNECRGLVDETASLKVVSTVLVERRELVRRAR